MYVSGSADWAKQKNSKEKGHCFILMSNAPFYGLIRLSYAQAHHQYFLISGSFYLARDSSLLFVMKTFPQKGATTQPAQRAD